MADDHYWNLEEGRGDYSQTEVKGPIIEVHLGLNKLKGLTVPVGVFRLNLVLLARERYVRRHGRGYNIQINREEDGSYTLGLDRNHRTPLEQFRK